MGCFMKLFVLSFLVFFEVFNFGNVLASQQLAMKYVFGSLGSAPGQLKEPTQLCSLPDDGLLVINFRNNSIVRVDNAGNFVCQWGSYGLRRGQFYFPLDLTVIKDKNSSDGSSLLVAVIDRSFRIQFFKTDGKYVSKMKLKFVPKLLTTDNLNNLIMIDQKNQVWKMGNRMMKPQKFEIPVKLDNPTDIAIDRNSGKWYISEMSNKVIGFSLIKSDSNQEITKTIIIENPGFNNGQFYFPSGLTVLPSGKLCVVDMFTSRIHIFDKSGHITQEWDLLKVSGLLSINPIKIEATSSGDLVVTDKYHHHVVRFGIK